MKIDGIWTKEKREFNNNISHGLCLDCFKKAMEKLNRIKKDTKKEVKIEP